MIIRKRYLNQILPNVDKPVIKIISGMRKVGKSIFFQMIMAPYTDLHT